MELETLSPSQTRPRVEVLTRFAEARADWVELLACAPASPYQSYDYVSLWFETVGPDLGLSPFIVVARDPRGAPLALVPLATRRMAGLCIAEFLCGRDSNLNLALLRPGTTLDLRRILLGAARKGAHPVDIYVLRNQPRRFAGADNLLAQGEAGASASFAYGTSLPADPAALWRRLSKEARKKLRKKEQRLVAQGDLVFEHGVQGARAKEIVAAMIAQKSARFVEMGVSSPFSSPQKRAFLERASAAGVIEAHALVLSGRIVATYLGLVHRERFSALANSFASDRAVARCSPGDVLLHALMRDLVRRGFADFDLGIGEARYKDSVCDDVIELSDATIAVTRFGALAAPGFRMALSLKRTIKQTPWLSRLAMRLRRFAARRRSG
jgi:CelD/BcsL family acetyltransferase involved in cellulose biosynthesis